MMIWQRMKEVKIFHKQGLFDLLHIRSIAYTLSVIFIDIEIVMGETRNNRVKTRIGIHSMYELI